MSPEVIMGLGMLGVLGVLASGGLGGGNVFNAQLGAQDIYRMADELGRVYFPTVDPLMVTAIAKIESSFRPLAERAEPHINDRSIGLMQTLVKTAQWLWDDMGARDYPRPSAASLGDPLTSLYFGMAYLNWLKSYRGQAQPVEFVVRAYNGGPGGANIAQTAVYFEKYRKARSELASMLAVPGSWS